MADFDDIDPTDARTVHDLVTFLKRLRGQAGNPSLRDLERGARRAGRRLPRSSIADMLAAKRLPRKELFLAYLEACGLSPSADPRWLVAWNRVAAREANPEANLHRPLGQDLIADVRAAGLTRIGTTYMTGMQWNRLFADVRELDIYVAYGQTWTRMNARDLARVAGRPGARIRVILADPDDEFTISALAARFNLTQDELRQRIHATHADYTALRTEGGAAVELYYRPGDRMFSFYRLDDTVVIGMYSHSRSRAASVPVFVCQQPGDLYDFVREEWNAVLLDARPA